MKVLIVLIFILASSFCIAGTSMHLEGSCKGKLADSSPVSFTYYSDFDGCKQTSKAAIAFQNGKFSDKGLFTGTRTFQNGKDKYSFPQNIRLQFKDSTGNVTGILITASGSVKVKCEIRDYEYNSEC